MLTTHTFDVIADRRTVEIECQECGLPRKRVLKAFQTINPYNRNKDGSMKSRSDIYAELPAQLDKMERTLKAKPLICKTCQQDIKEASAP